MNSYNTELGEEKEERYAFCWLYDRPKVYKRCPTQTRCSLMHQHIQLIELTISTINRFSGGSYYNKRQIIQIHHKHIYMRKIVLH
jgi:hypothetical protein